MDKNKKSPAPDLAPIRFYAFVQLMDGIGKSIRRIREEYAPELGIKSVHVFWLYTLLEHPDGLTATELAAKTAVDRSLVSREIADLQKRGYIEITENGDRRKKYNARLTLTPDGVALGHRIRTVAVDIQNRMDEGIGEEELASFYATLEKLHGNFQTLTQV